MFEYISSMPNMKRTFYTNLYYDDNGGIRFSNKSAVHEKEFHPKACLLQLLKKKSLSYVVLSMQMIFEAKYIEDAWNQCL